MKTTDKQLSEQLPNRRKFLKATATMAGMTVIGSLDMRGFAGAPEGGKLTRSVSYGMKQGEVITIRGHHLFDILAALGTGTDTSKNSGPIVMKIRANPKTPLKIVVGIDDICSACEWWNYVKNRCVRNIDKYPQDDADNIEMDKNTIRVLGMKAGDVMNADEIYLLIKTKVTRKVFAEEVCAPCRLVKQCEKVYEQRIEAAVKAVS